MENWDLQAVVRGCTKSSRTIQQEQPNLLSPQLLKTTTVRDELFRNPYYSLFQPFPQQLNTSVSIPQGTTNGIHETKSKKGKKNQEKKVVEEVTAEGLSMDKWAWRKYGQKPIKGSPYPRSYYRCSSSKGCVAKKQVERSPLDPKLYIITYTAEHSHGHPPRRRNSRNKSSSSQFQTPNEPQAPVVPAPIITSADQVDSLLKNEEDYQPIFGTNEGIDDFFLHEFDYFPMLY